MRFEHEGMSLWFGTADTPVPGETVPAGIEATITVAVKPISASNRVELRYRVNQGTTEILAAKRLPGHSALSQSQYFTISLPAFRAGDSVEYRVICYCAGCQVPSPEQAENFASSFRVIESVNETTLSITANESLPIETAVVANLINKTTSSSESNVVKPSQLETRINTIKTVLSHKEHQQAVDSAMRTTNGDMSIALTNLTGKLPTASLQKIALANSLADWSEDHTPVVNALARQPELKNLRDVALGFNVDKLSTLVDPKVVSENIIGATDEEKKRNFAVALDNKLFVKEPTAVLQRMVQDAEIPIADPNLRSGVATFLANQPDFNIRTTSIYTALKHPEAFKGIAEAHRAGVVEQLKTLQQVHAISPTPKTVVELMKANQTSASRIAKMPESTFMNMYSELLGNGIAQQAYTNAMNTHIRNENALIATAYQGKGLAMTNDQRTNEKGFITLQKTIEYKGESPSPISKIRLAVLFPKFAYTSTTVDDEVTNVNRTIESTDCIKVDDDYKLSNGTYSISVPTSYLIGNNNETIKKFLIFTFTDSPTKNINDLSFCIQIQAVADSAVIATSTFNAFYIVKSPRLYGLMAWKTPAAMMTYDAPEPSEAAYLPFLEKNVFLINKDAYDKILTDFKNITKRYDDDLLLWSVISQFVSAIDINPTELMEWNEDVSNSLDGVLEENIERSDKTIKFIKDNFNALFDFRIVIPPIKTIKVAGIFEVKTPDNAPITKQYLPRYKLTLEYSSYGVNNLIISNSVDYQWESNDDPIIDNKISFSFPKSPPIILNSISGQITISVEAFGTVLWNEKFEPVNPVLQNVMIVVSELRPVTLNPVGAKGGTNTGKKLRGKVIELTKKCSLKDITVVIQAKKAEDESWCVVASANTDASGNFSMLYPCGEYVKAQAIVSLTPDKPVDIQINNLGNKNETIGDGKPDYFLQLLITNPECPDTSKGEDCDCKAPKKASRLPDQADLINSDEYTQDIGGSCVNLSTPNRTLSEHNYQAIVRTSDPDVANYTLKKTTPNSSWYLPFVAQPLLIFEEIDPIKTKFELKGGAETIKRKPVCLGNPIKWQDAPEPNNKEDLSFYQAVTIATGHILHYKAVTKADGYSLGDLLYSLALAPGQKKQIVVIDSAHSLQASETQNITQAENLKANLVNERNIADQLGGNINEAMQGRSSASTSGVSAGIGVGANLGVVSGALGVAGGYSSSNASASQNSSRDTAMFFGENLRQSIMQNAESYRQLNATVVTSVQEGQHYAATTDVVANHNHCHALTMMYFEVLRHYAIYQELSHVEECVFVPLLMTNFTVENIYKWHDVLASHLLPMPSNTYLQPFSFLRYRVQHPLIPAFDANERIKTRYVHVDFPTGAFCDEPITSVTGYITIRVDIPRPKTVYDRVMSFPIEKKEIIHDRNGGGILGRVADIFVGSNNVATQWEEKIKFADEHIVIYDNFQTARPADVIEVIKFDNFFKAGSKDDFLWAAIAKLCGEDNVEAFLEKFFSHKTISQWDATFNDEIAPKIFGALVDRTISISPFSAIDFTTIGRYNGGERLMRMNLRCNTSLPRKDIANIVIKYANKAFNADIFFASPVTFLVENLNINYTTKHYEGTIVNKYIGDDLYETPPNTAEIIINTPMNSDEQRNPRLEDIYIVTKLIEHLNSNLEHYNKVLWYKLDVDRRFMLLDGFAIQIYDDKGKPIPESAGGSRSLASVVKNELITVVGNSLVFPVAAGYRVSDSYIREDTAEGDTEKVTLLDHYKPLTPIPPYRISLPTRGVFAEAVQGACDACEKEKEKSSQDWTKFTTDEPTPIATVQPPVPTITDWKAAWKDFAPPLINIQNAPATPEPGAGLTGLTELLGKSGVFKDITGLDATQQNVIRTYLSNQENAKAFAEMAKSMATQDHNTQHSDKIMDTLKAAKDSGAINQDEYGKLVKDHIQKQIDGGEAQNQQAAQQSKKQETSPIKSLVDLAQTSNTEGSATEIDGNGNAKTLDIKSKGDSSSKSNTTLKYDFTVPGTIEAIKQQSANACWATVTTMMSNWKKQQTQSVDDYIQGIGAEYVPFIQTGITIAKLTDFCNAAGLNTAYSNTEYPVSFYYDILKKNGPIWVIDLESANPKMLHGRLLIGIKGDDSSTTTIFTIIDPATGKQYDEPLPTFVSKMENVVKTLDAIKDVQIPLLIYYKDSYDKSKSSDTSNGDATIGTGGVRPVTFTPVRSDEVGKTLATFMHGSLIIFVPQTVRTTDDADIPDPKVHVFFAAFDGPVKTEVLIHGLRGASNNSEWITIAVPGVLNSARPISEAEILDCLRSIGISSTPSVLRLSGHSRGCDSLMASFPKFKINTLKLIDRVVFLDEAVEHQLDKTKPKLGSIRLNRVKNLTEKPYFIPADRIVSYEVGNRSFDNFEKKSVKVAQAKYFELEPDCMMAIGCVRLISDAIAQRPNIADLVKANTAIVDQLSPFSMPVRGGFSVMIQDGEDLITYCNNHSAAIKQVKDNLNKPASLLAFVNKNDLAKFGGFQFLPGIAAHHFFVAEIAHELTK